MNIDLSQYPETETFRAALQAYDEAEARLNRLMAQRAGEVVVLAAQHELHAAHTRIRATRWPLRDKLKERYNCEAVNAAIHDFEMRFKSEVE